MVKQAVLEMFEHLNGAFATLDALPEVVHAVQSHDRKIPVHMGGGDTRCVQGAGAGCRFRVGWQDL